MSDLAELATLGTPTISDAMDRLGLPCQLMGIMPLSPEFSLCGPAFTIRYQPVGENGGSVGDYIDDVPAGSVVVIDNAGRTDVTVWGDILTMVAARRSVAGTVIDGVCRDVARAAQLNYPIFSRGNWMRTGKDRVAMVAVQGPVVIGGVTTNAGDVMVGDRDGVLSIRASRLSEVLDTAREIEHAEDRIRQSVSGGTSLLEARRRNGYHHLQTRHVDRAEVVQ
jgi:4-hydroxy-4-methyl-2-oxoglutarate aldolase